MTFRQLSGIAGIGFVVVVIAVNVVIGATSPPRGAVPVATVAAYYTANATALKVGVALSPLAWALLALFAAGLVASIWPREAQRQEGWAWLGLLGVAMQNAIFAAVVSLQAALVMLAASPDPSMNVLGGLWSVHHALFALNGTSLALALAGFSVGALRAGVIPQWHAYLGLVGAVLTLAGTLQAAGVEGVGLLGLAGFALWLVWILSFGIRMITDSSGRAASIVEASARGWSR